MKSKGKGFLYCLLKKRISRWKFITVSNDYGIYSDTVITSVEKREDLFIFGYCSISIVSTGADFEIQFPDLDGSSRCLYDNTSGG